MKKQSLLATKSVDSLIAEATSRNWNPPEALLSELDRIIKHNAANPKNRVGARKIVEWLSENGVSVGKDAVSNWMKKRGAV